MLKTDAQTLYHCKINFFALIIFLFPIFLGGCASEPPNEDYSLATIAIEAAKVAGAPKVSIGYWSKAQASLKQGEEEYEQREFPQAKASFIKARNFAEKAENAARIKRLRSGEVF